MADLTTELKQFLEQSPLYREFQAFQIPSYKELYRTFYNRREAAYQKFLIESQNLNEQEAEKLEKRIREELKVKEEKEEQEWYSKAIPQEEVSKKLAAALRERFPNSFQFVGLKIASELHARIPLSPWNKETLDPKVYRGLEREFNLVSVPKYSIVQVFSDPDRYRYRSNYHCLFLGDEGLSGQPQLDWGPEITEECKKFFASIGLIENVTFWFYVRTMKR